MKNIISYILEGRYSEASAECNRQLNDLVDEYRTLFDDVEELELDISNGVYGKVVQDKFNSLMRWDMFIYPRLKEQTRKEIERKTKIY